MSVMLSVRRAFISFILLNIIYYASLWIDNGGLPMIF